MCIMKMWNIILESYHHLLDTQPNIFSYHTWNDDYILNPSSWNFYGMCTHTHPYILMLMMCCRLSFNLLTFKVLRYQMILMVKYKWSVKKDKVNFSTKCIIRQPPLGRFHLLDYSLYLKKVSSLFTISHTIALNWPGIKL